MPEPMVVDAPVVEVLVLEDRAQVVRGGRVGLPAGRSVVRIPGVAPVLSDKTLTATATGPSTVRVTMLRVERTARIVEADRRAAVAALEDEVRRVERELASTRSAMARSQSEREQLAEALALTLADIAEDAAAGREAAADWQLAVARIGQRQEALSEAEAEFAQVAAERIRDLEDLRARLSATSHPGDRLAAVAILEVDASAAGEFELRLSYLVPGACWRPWHTATLGETAQPVVEVVCDACVWQNTGEDWNGVALSCSTERPSLGTTPPQLDGDVLTLRPKASGTVVETRDEVVHTTGGAGGQPVQEVLGIDDGGEARQLRASGPATVPSDGLPHRVPLFRCSAPAEVALLVFGEIAPAAIRRTTQANAATAPLLAGPVDLIRRGGYAGRSSVLFVAPGARFDLGWGPDPDVRVHRETQESPGKPSLMSTWTTIRHQVDLQLSNLAREERTVQVVERIPVSEIERVAIEVEEDATSPPAQPDADGFLRWSVTLPPRGHARIRLGWRLRKHPDVIGI
jgi:uncharacterized protein (TIGR02231 family)